MKKIKAERKNEISKKIQESQPDPHGVTGLISVMAQRSPWKEGAIRMNSTILRASITSVFAGPQEQLFESSQF